MTKMTNMSTMSSDLSSTTTVGRRVTLVAALCAFGIASTACSSSNAETASVTPDVDGAREAPSFGDLEYGDSFEELKNTSARRPEPATTVLPGVRLLDWEDLVPAGFSSDEILARYQDRMAAAAPGSPELDAVYEEMIAEYDDASINPELDSEDIQLAGFVAPLTYDGDAITEFLLVPYFGACIHVPPPPANQTVMVTLADGESLTLEESWGAVTVAGTMTAASTTTDLATAGYSVSGARFDVYDNQ